MIILWLNIDKIKLVEIMEWVIDIVMMVRLIDSCSRSVRYNASKGPILAVKNEVYVY